MNESLTFLGHENIEACHIFFVPYTLNTKIKKRRVEGSSEI
jgi:hypothetical protein